MFLRLHSLHPATGAGENTDLILINLDKIKSIREAKSITGSEKTVSLTELISSDKGGYTVTESLENIWEMINQPKKGK